MAGSAQTAVLASSGVAGMKIISINRQPQSAILIRTVQAVVIGVSILHWRLQKTMERERLKLISTIVQTWLSTAYQASHQAGYLVRSPRREFGIKEM